jgi:protein-disulfide isomerase
MSAQQTGGLKRYLPLIIIGGVLLVAIVAGASMLRSTDGPADSAGGAANRSGGPARQGAAATAPAAGPVAIAPGAEPPHVIGVSNAPVTLEEFGDYQCPPCGNLHPVLKRIEHDYGSRVRVVFRNLPLESIHKNAFLAARAAEAAGLQGKFWEMHDLLYERQKDWSGVPLPRPVFSGYARQLGLDIARFERDIDRPEVGVRIGADMRRADSLRVSSTPTVFLNGRELPPSKSLDEKELRGEIDAALAGKSQ